MKHDDKQASAKSAYGKLEKKYKLPALEDVQREFSVRTDAVDEEMILQSLRDCMSEFIKRMIEDMDYILFGNDKYLPRISKDDRTRIFDSYKKMQAALWEGKIAALEDEQSLADWIKKTFQAWQKELKAEALWYSKKVHQSWTESKGSESDVRYVG
ncbi:MAG: hypothetical protein V1678_01210 [Candidatus Aenigmatarchaeota archaeon]